MELLSFLKRLVSKKKEIKKEKVILIGAGKGAQLCVVALTHYFLSEVEFCYVLDDIKSPEFQLLDYDKPKLFMNEVPFGGKAKEMVRYGKEHLFLITFSKDMRRRKEVFDYCKIYGYDSINFIRSVSCKRCCDYGQGNFIFSGCTFDHFTKLGDNNVISANCTIGHHSTIGSHNLLGPGCQLSGSVFIGDCCKIGAGCIFHPGVVIGNNVDIASGTIVVSDLPDGTSIKAKLIPNNKAYTGDRIYSNKTANKSIHKEYIVR